MSIKRMSEIGLDQSDLLLPLRCLNFLISFLLRRTQLHHLFTRLSSSVLLKLRKTKQAENFFWPTSNICLTKLNRFRLVFWLIHLLRQTRFKTISNIKHLILTSSHILQDTTSLRSKTRFKFLICLQDFTWMMFVTLQLLLYRSLWSVLAISTPCSAKSLFWSSSRLLWTSSCSWPRLMFHTQLTLDHLNKKCSHFQLQESPDQFHKCRKISESLKTQSLLTRREYTTVCNNKRMKWPLVLRNLWLSQFYWNYRTSDSLT